MAKNDEHQALDIKPSNIRIWIHNRDIGKLQYVLWEGHGSKLRCETSNNVRVRRFLEAAPYIMVTIKDIHAAVIKNDIDGFRSKVEDPVSPIILCSKDSNGLNVLHKAAGLGYLEMAKEILDKYPSIVNAPDNEGRTPLHYAAICRDGGLMYGLLVDYGADENKLDSKQKNAAHYKVKPTEIDMSSLVMIPEAPRVSGSNYPKNWDWRIIDSEQPIRTRRNGASNNNNNHNADDDSAFGSAESAKLLEATPESETAEDEPNGNGEENVTDNGADESENQDVIEEKSETSEKELENEEEITTEEKLEEKTEDEKQKSLDEEENIKQEECKIDDERENLKSEEENVKMTDIEEDNDLEKGTLEDKENSELKENKSDNEQEKLDSDENPESREDNIDDEQERFENDERSVEMAENNDAEQENIESKEDNPTVVENNDQEEKLEKEEESLEQAEDNSQYQEKLENEEENPEEGESKLTENESENLENEEQEKLVFDEEPPENDEILTVTVEESESITNIETRIDQPADANNNEAELVEESKETLEPENEETVETPILEDEAKEISDEDIVRPKSGIQESNDEETEKIETAENETNKENSFEEANNADSDSAIIPNDDEQEIISQIETAAVEAEKEKIQSQEEPEEEEVAEPTSPPPEPSPPPQPEKEEEEEEEEVEAEEKDSEVKTNGMAVDDEDGSNYVDYNMEQLAALVLTGEGHRLVGRQSSNPELQAFIDNVPEYMVKIRAVHKASREGSLKDLQINMDRRKFAIAKDSSSPHGATPLHVAVIFGHTPIIRFLAGRFPETNHALDFDGRTPLHYAAVLADNGHYYNLLLNLGANPLVQDNFGQKADFYKKNQQDLSHKQLLRDFGAPESLADEMLQDKDPKLFQDEEGHYLASSLGDPLIKGLTEVASTRPKDPVTYLASYLYNFANQDKPKDKNEEQNILIIPEERENGGTEENNGEQNHVQDQENDDGYPQSPDLDAPVSLFAETERDENGQSPLHFAANRSHSKDGLYHLLQERQINIACRDSRYRTARDVAEQSRNRENVQEIDRFVVYLAARGETDRLVELLMEGYDHILDTQDDRKSILQIAEEEDNRSTVKFLKSIPNYTEQRDALHRAIRTGNTLRVQELLESNGNGARLLAVGKNAMGRCSLHVAVLKEHADIVRYLARTYPETLRIGDNLDRTPLHYAMGVPTVEIMSSILIKAGAKRVQKDLRSRQPTYYFMNKTDIKHLQDEEEFEEKKK